MVESLRNLRMRWARLWSDSFLLMDTWDDYMSLSAMALGCRG